MLLSRSGPSRSTEAQRLLAELRQRGVRVEAPRCDVADRAALRALLDACSARMPPVKGCIQAAMVMTVSERGQTDPSGLQEGVIVNAQMRHQG